MLFESSKPVSGKYFFDREEELGRLLKTLPKLKKEAPDYLALLGLRKIGKTSILSEFIEQIKDSRIYAIKVDCWEKENLSMEFFRNYLVKTIDAFWLRNEELRPISSLESCIWDRESLLNIAAEIKRLKIKALDRGIQALFSLLEGKIDSAVIGAIIDLPQRIAAEKNVYFVVIIDEFQEVENLNKFYKVKKNLGNIYSFLRSKWQNHSRVNYIIAGSKLSLMKNILLDSNSPFFQHFKIIDIGPFSEAKARQMLGVISKNINRQIPTKLIDRIIELVGTNPFYLQILGEELCQKNRIDEDLFKVTVQETLFNTTGRLFLYFEDLFGKIVGKSASLENTLVSVAEAPKTLTEKAKDLSIGTGTLKSWIDRIGDVIIKVGNIYKITDSCFALWLKSRSSLRSILPPLVLGDEAEKLVARRLSAVGFQLVYQSRASRGAFDLLGIIATKKIGVQVKKGKFPVYFKRESIQEMKYWAKELCWHPIIAIVTNEGCSFYELFSLKKGKRGHKIDQDTKEIENILDIYT